MKDLTISLEDRPGTLADAGEALGKAGINIEGFAGMAVGGRGVMHVLVDDAAGARAALEGAGITIEREDDPLVLNIVPAEAARPGALGTMARRVADAGVNVTAIYIATGDRGVCITGDNEKAKAALGM